MTRALCTAIAAGLFFAAGSAANADDVSASMSGNRIAVNGAEALRNTKLSIVGPNGFHVEEFANSGSPSAVLGGLSSLPDGTYVYEITGATGQMEPVAEKLDNGRGKDARPMRAVGQSASGSFTIVGGKIVTDSPEQK